jgi:hypothetical protein
VGCFNYLGSLIASNACDIKSRIVMAKPVLNEKKTVINKLGLYVRIKLIECCVWSVAFLALKSDTLDRSEHGSGEGWRRSVGPIA